MVVVPDRPEDQLPLGLVNIPNDGSSCLESGGGDGDGDEAYESCMKRRWEELEEKVRNEPPRVSCTRLSSCDSAVIRDLPSSMMANEFGKLTILPVAHCHARSADLYFTAYNGRGEMVESPKHLHRGSLSPALVFPTYQKVVFLSTDTTIYISVDPCWIHINKTPSHDAETAFGSKFAKLHLTLAEMSYSIRVEYAGRLPRKAEQRHYYTPYVLNVPNRKRSICRNCNHDLNDDITSIQVTVIPRDQPSYGSALVVDSAPHSLKLRKTILRASQKTKWLSFTVLRGVIKDNCYQPFGTESNDSHGILEATHDDLKNVEEYVQRIYRIPNEPRNFALPGRLLIPASSMNWKASIRKRPNGEKKRGFEQHVQNFTRLQKVLEQHVLQQPYSRSFLQNVHSLYGMMQQMTAVTPITKSGSFVQLTETKFERVCCLVDGCICSTDPLEWLDELTGYRVYRPLKCHSKRPAECCNPIGVVVTYHPFRWLCAQHAAQRFAGLGTYTRVKQASTAEDYETARYVFQTETIEEWLQDYPQDVVVRDLLLMQFVRSMEHCRRYDMTAKELHEVLVPLLRYEPQSGEKV